MLYLDLWNLRHSYYMFVYCNIDSKIHRFLVTLKKYVRVRYLNPNSQHLYKMLRRSERNENSSTPINNVKRNIYLQNYINYTGLTTISYSLLSFRLSTACHTLLLSQALSSSHVTLPTCLSNTSISYIRGSYFDISNFN